MLMLNMKTKILQRFVNLYNDVKSPHVRLHLDAKGALEAMFLYNNDPKAWVRHPSLSTAEDMLDRMLEEPLEVPRVALLQADNTMNRLLCQAYLEVYDG